MRPTEFAALMQRFFRAAIKVFTWTDAIVDKMVGDEVIGIYAPCLTGPDYRKRAVAAGLKLLRATGHADPAGPWLSIGVGVHSGETFLGSVGVEGGNYQFAALGPPMNFGARLVASAKGGEMILSEEVWQDVSGTIPAEPRSLELKGHPGAGARLRHAGRAGLDNPGRTIEILCIASGGKADVVGSRDSALVIPGALV